MKHKQNLIWIDLEMTGLNPDKNTIIEIATVVTDKNLVVLAQGPCLAIHQSEATLAKMDKWNVKHHTQSGLVERVRNSQVCLLDAQQQTLEFLTQWVDANISPMCGNSICMDRQFLRVYMPELCQYFHYRHIDVSTLKELVSRWQPEAKMQFSKESAHLALSDIYDSIDELKHYREQFIKI